MNCLEPPWTSRNDKKHCFCACTRSSDELVQLARPFVRFQCVYELCKVHTREWLKRVYTVSAALQELQFLEKYVRCSVFVSSWHTWRWWHSSTLENVDTSLIVDTLSGLSCPPPPRSLPNAGWLPNLCGCLVLLYLLYLLYFWVYASVNGGRDGIKNYVFFRVFYKSLHRTRGARFTGSSDATCSLLQWREEFLLDRVFQPTSKRIKPRIIDNTWVNNTIKAFKAKYIQLVQFIVDKKKRNNS